MNLALELQKDKPLRDDNALRRGYRMIQSFQIENFRCFRQLSLKDLRTINIIVGDNGSGKTALLEALLLAAHAHPRAATMLREVRNHPLPQGQIRWDRLLFQSIWEDLFYDFENSAISANFTDSSHGTFGVVVAYVEPEQSPGFSLVDPIPELTFVRKRADGSETIATIKIDNQGNPVTEGLGEMIPPVYFLPAASQFFREDCVTLFAAMSRMNDEGIVVKSMRQDFSQIADIEILVDSSGPGLFIRGKPALSRKQSLGTVSAGAARYLNILLAVATRHKGIVLVDEIENGIYWKRMPNIWKRLRELCVKRGVQLFATTHSNECLRSLMGAMRKHEDDFSLIRVTAHNDGHSVEQFSGGLFLAALEGRGEIR